MLDLSIVIPAYNEAERIAPTLQQLHQYLTARPWSYEIIVVDDGSADDTASVVQSLIPITPHLRLVHYGANKGKGYAVRTGMLAAQGSIRLFADADGSTPFSELSRLLPVIQQGTAIAIGSRYLPGSAVVQQQPALRVAWSRLVNRLMQRTILPGILDTHCGFKAFTDEAAIAVFSRCSVNGWSFDLEALAIARSLGFTISEVPVTWSNDARSKARLRHLPAELRAVYRIRRRVREMRHLE